MRRRGFLAPLALALALPTAGCVVVEQPQFFPPAAMPHCPRQQVQILSQPQAQPAPREMIEAVPSTPPPADIPAAGRAVPRVGPPLSPARQSSSTWKPVRRVRTA